MKCNGVVQDFHGFSAVIMGFQQRHSFLEIHELHVHEVSVDEINGHGQMTAALVYLAKLHSGPQDIQSGDCVINFRQDKESGYWNIVDINMPGITSFRPSPG